MHIALSEAAFDPWKELQNYQASQVGLAGKFGATSVFVGSMRDFNQGDVVQSMYLEHYPGMTENQLQKTAEQAFSQWALLDCLILHRIGLVYPEEVLVLVVAWAAHRGDAFDASRFMMENLKHSAPFWKKEALVNGQERWIENNSCGYL